MSKYVRGIDYTIYDLDKNLRIIDADSNFEKLTGYSIDDIKNNIISQTDLIPSEDVEGYLSEVNDGLNKRNEAFIEHRLKTKSGDEIFVFCLGCINLDDKNPASYTIRVTRVDDTLCLFFKEKTLKKVYNKKLKEFEKEAVTDDLTGLLRRDPFINYVNDYLCKKKPLCLLLIDLDNFKNVNDTYGHNIGDEVLIKTADAFRVSINDGDYICRLGGDEFAILLESVANLEQAKVITKKIIKNVANIRISADANYKVSVSIGLKFIKQFDDCVSFNSLYNEADVALYKSKEDGKNRYTIAN